MTVPQDRLVAIIGQRAADALERAGVKVVNEQEYKAWADVVSKYEFMISALDMIAKKPLRSNPEVDANELRYLVEKSLVMMGIAKGCTPFDDLRFQLTKEEVWRMEATKILQTILDSGCVDSSIEMAVRSLLGVRSSPP